MVYQKASQLGDPDAFLYLGQFYQVEHPGVQKDLEIAFNFYLQAAQRGQLEALSPLDRLGEEVSAENQWALSKFYGRFFNDNEKANYWRNQAQEAENLNMEM